MEGTTENGREIIPSITKSELVNVPVTVLDISRPFPIKDRETGSSKWVKSFILEVPGENKGEGITTPEKRKILVEVGSALDLDIKGTRSVLEWRPTLDNKGRYLVWSPAPKVWR